MRRLIVIAITVLAFATLRPARAELTRQQIDAIVKPAIEMEYCKGLVVGVIDERGRQVYGYGVTADGGDGAADRNAGTTPDGKTVFEIGSITKAFTAELLAIMVESGEVQLDQPVRELLPAEVEVPRKGEKQITLRHLASHVSGLPRMPPNFAPADDDDPYADFTADKLYEALARAKLTHEPGERYRYSNLGAGLLGHALALRAGTTYEQLLIDRICQPLGMHDTRVRLSDDMRSRLAPGHGGRKVLRNWEFDALAGAGGIRSTVDDLLTFLAANAGLIESPLLPAMKRTHERQTDGGGGVALGWHVGRDTAARWHNGQTGGYHSFAAFVPETRFGVVVLSNSAGPTVDELGTALVRASLGLPYQTLPVRTPMAIDPPRLDDYVGRYAIAPTFVIAITREGNRLFEQATGQDAFELFPEADDRFFLRGVDAQISFERNESGQVWRLILHQNGADQPGGRITEEATDTPDEMQPD